MVWNSDERRTAVTLDDDEHTPAGKDSRPSPDALASNPPTAPRSLPAAHRPAGIADASALATTSPLLRRGIQSFRTLDANLDANARSMLVRLQSDGQARSQLKSGGPDEEQRDESREPATASVSQPSMSGAATAAGANAVSVAGTGSALGERAASLVSVGSGDGNSSLPVSRRHSDPDAWLQEATVAETQAMAEVAANTSSLRATDEGHMLDHNQLDALRDKCKAVASRLPASELAWLSDDLRAGGERGNDAAAALEALLQTRKLELHASISSEIGASTTDADSVRRLALSSVWKLAAVAVLAELHRVVALQESAEAQWVDGGGKTRAELQQAAEDEETSLEKVRNPPGSNQASRQA